MSSFVDSESRAPMAMGLGALTPRLHRRGTRSETRAVKMCREVVSLASDCGRHSALPAPSRNPRFDIQPPRDSLGLTRQSLPAMSAMAFLTAFRPETGLPRSLAPRIDL